jgi:succinoglycan biosynthesis transport protein ExoP
MKRFIWILRRHWKLLLCVNVVIIGGVAIAQILTTQKSWVANSQLVLPDADTSLTADLGTLGSLENQDPSFSSEINPLQLQKTILGSDEIMRRLWREDPEQEEFSKLSSYKKLFLIETVYKSPVLEISATGSTPEIATARIDRMVEVYQDRLNELRQDNSLTRDRFSLDKLATAQANLEQAQAALAKFQADSGLVNPQEQTKSLAVAINNLEEEYVLAQAGAQAQASQLRVLADRLGLAPAVAVQSLGLNENPAYAQVRQELTKVAIQLERAQIRFTPEHPQVQELAQRSARLEAQLQRYISAAGIDLPDLNAAVTSGAEGRTELIQQMLIAESIAQSRQQQANRIATEIDRLRQTLAQIPTANQRLLELQRNYAVTEGVYKGLVAQIEQSNLDSFNTYPNVQVLDPPQVNPVPSKLKLAMLNAILAGTLTSVALLFFLERRNPLLLTEDLRGHPFVFVSIIPWAKALGAPNGLSRTLSQTPLLPEFNLLASHCLPALDRDRMLLVTSAATGEGKTFVCLGLARALNALGFRVLIADSSVENRLLQRFPDAAPQPIPELGLTHQQIEPGLGLVSLLDPERSGAKLFAQGDFKNHLAKIKTSLNYDYVLIDTAAIAITSAPLFMSQSLHQIMFVIQPNLSKRDLVLNALNCLAQNANHRISLVVNGDTERVELKAPPMLSSSGLQA